MHKFFTVIILLLSLKTSAQKIFGTVYNENGDLLPYASITIKGTSIGASANNKARFAIAVSPGTYTVICQHIGYVTKTVTMTIDNDDKEAFFILAEQKLALKEVIVKNGGEDPAYEIIRQAIKKRTYYAKQVNEFTCDLYTKDIIKLKKLPQKILGQKVEKEDKDEMMLDTAGKGIIYLSESIANIATRQPDKFKTIVKSSRVSGSNSFGFTFPTFISLYQNNVVVFIQQFNPRGFVSPIADGAIGFYKFKFLGSFFEDGKEINSIRVTPRRNYEPLFSGIINITEGDWRIQSFDLILTKKSQLEIVDTLQLTQMHLPVTNDIWRVKNQLIHFDFDQFGVKAAGNFVSVYSNYNVDPKLAKKYFDNVVMKYDTGANKKAVTYWDSIRPVPLEREEVKDYKVKDSLFELQNNKPVTQADIDSLRKKQGKIKFLQLFWSGIDRTHYSLTNPYNWGIDPVLQSVQYNTAEGVVLNVDGYYDKRFKKSGTRLTVQPNIRYGFSNTHLNAFVDVGLRMRDFDSTQKLKRQSWDFSGGKRVSQFNKASTITPLINTISTLLYGDNYMKTYENWFGSVAYSKRFENGFRFKINALYEDRIPLDNTTNYTFNKADSVNITPNYPYQKIPAQFTRHRALSVGINVSIKPGQKYIQYPGAKISIGSKYPTFSLSYTKGLNNVLGSDVDYDRWDFSIADDKNFKLAGLMKYKIVVGGFLNSKSVPFQDYLHFNGNRSAAASEYVNSFQLARHYEHDTIASIYTVAHLEHHFNGLLTNKIPLLKRWNWNLVAGGNALYVNKNNNYVEVFTGLENILKMFRVDIVWAFANGNKTSTGIRIGYGGLLGGSVKRAGRSRSISLNANF